MVDRPAEPTEAEQLSALFGAYKAEWLGERLFDLFAEPTYFPELTEPRPCLLRGGRGTGKTTVLRGLSYEGRLALTKDADADIAHWPYFGIYYRVDTNRVAAFTGSELTNREWVPRFAHYFNLTICRLVVRFLTWYELHTGESLELGPASLRNVCTSLNLDEVTTSPQLAEALDLALTRFEAYINNVADGEGPKLSMQGAPIDALLDSVSRLPQFAGKNFFFLIDEYENFSDYQQQVVNTLIKHSGPLYTFKIGVRELGWRTRTTLNENEHLISPADYMLIDIADKLREERFNEFAYAVCRERLDRIRPQDSPVILDIRDLLPGLTEEQEADLLGVREKIVPVTAELMAKGVTKKIIDQLTPLRFYLVAYWAEGEGRSLAEEFSDAVENPSTWDTRYGNYKHALLFTLRRGKRGIPKYYEGWSTFIQVAGGNIRYLLELVYQSLAEHLERGGKLSAPVPVGIQTQAAQRVGNENLRELEGLSIHGASLTKLALGLGRVFGIMAAHPEGSAPEVNQFRLSGDIDPKVKEILDSAVMHLALLRSSGTKPGDVADTREYDYFLHPIFAPFFVFSYRRKRKMVLTGGELLGLVSSHRQTIRAILAKSGRTIQEELPEQLSLFETYFAPDS